jgi:hypothetical protein
MSLPQWQCDLRGSLYFGKYEYVVSLHIEDAWMLSSLSRTMILERIRKRDQYKSKIGHQLTSELTKQNIMHAVDVLETLDSTFIHRTYGHHTFHVYTNNIKDVEILYRNYPTESSMKQAVLAYPKDVIMLINQPKYPYRTYLKEKRLSEDKKQAVWNWISHQTPDLVVSPVTEKWFTDTIIQGYGWGRTPQNESWCREHYFVEHNDLKHITMLAMICPGLTRKTVQVQKRP